MKKFFKFALIRKPAREHQSLFMQIFSKIYVGLVLLFLYVPIFILMLFAFNNSGSIFTFKGFSFGFYYFKMVFTDPIFGNAILSTIIIAIFSTLIATVIGTFAALSLSQIKSKIGKISLAINDIPIINADIATAFALLLLFLSISFPFGFFSMLMAHVSFCLPYVVVTVLARIMFIDDSIIEASLDLGATPFTTLKKVVLPMIMPAIIIGAALSFAMSFDDFIVSYFTGGSVQNVSVYLYALKKFTPLVSAFSVLLIIAIASLFIGYNIIAEKRKRQKSAYTKLQKINQKLFAEAHHDATTNRKTAALLKEKVSLEKKIHKISDAELKKETLSLTHKNFIKKSVIAALMLASVFSLTGYYIYTSVNSFNISIFGSYVSPEAITGFEKKYHKNVRISNYSSSEQLYSKMKTTDFSLTMPSDYMVAKFSEQGLLQPINYEILNQKMHIENLQNDFLSPISTLLKTQNVQDEHGSNHPLSDYFLPYYWGSLALLVNSNKSNPAPIDKTNWNILWKAILDNKKIALSDDARNTYTMAFQLMIYNAQHPGELANFPALKVTEDDIKTKFSTYFENGINTSIHGSDTIDAGTQLFQWITKRDPNISFQGDDIQEKIITGDFDYALCYNSDIAYAYQGAHGGYLKNFDKYHLTYFQSASAPSNFSNDIWFDGFVIPKRQSQEKTKITYDFLAYLFDGAEAKVENIKKSVAWTNAKYSGAASTISTINQQQQADAKDPNVWNGLESLIQGPLKDNNFYEGYTTFILRLVDKYADGYNKILASLIH